MNLISWIAEPWFSARLTLALLHFLWQGCLGGLLVCLANWLLQQRLATLRYAINVTALFLLASCLPLTFMVVSVPVWEVGDRLLSTAGVGQESLLLGGHIPSTPIATGAESGVLTDESAVDTGDGSRSAQIQRPDQLGNRVEPATASALSIESFDNWSRWIAWLYLTCVTWSIGRLVVGVRGGARLRKASIPVEDAVLQDMLQSLARRAGLRVVPGIAWCRQISVPVVVGIVRPMILLPLSLASGLTTSQLQALLLHELAHIRRCDPIVNILQRAIEAVLFFHPAVWYVSRRIRTEREFIADDLVLAAGWDRPSYADALVRAAELAATVSRPTPSRLLSLLSATGTNPTEFKRRVLRLLQDPRPLKLEISRWGSLTTILIVAVTMSMTWFMTNKSEATNLQDRPAEQPIPQHTKLRISNPDGSPAQINAVLEAHVGFPLEVASHWHEFPDKSGTVSLQKLADGQHWLLAASDRQSRTLFQVTVPAKQPLIEQRLRDAIGLGDQIEIGRQPVVETNEDEGDVILFDVINRSDKPVQISEQNMFVLSTVQNKWLRGLSPQWVTADRRPFTKTTIESGQTGRLRLNWREWSRRGFWASRDTESIAEPGFPDREPGRIWVKIGLGIGTSLPVSVAEVPAVEVQEGAARDGDQEPKKPAVVNAALPRGLEFLAPYPRLHELSLEMTEPQFLAIVERHKLQVAKTTEQKRVDYAIELDDGLHVIVMFDSDTDGCRGIQRLRGKSSREQPVVQKLTAPVHVLSDHLNVMAVGFDRQTGDLITVATERDVAVRTWNVEKGLLKGDVKLQSDKHGNFFLSGHLTLSADRKHVVALLEGQLRIWDAATGKLEKALSVPDDMRHGMLRGLSCTPDFSRIASGWLPGRGDFGSHDAFAVVWNVQSGVVERTVRHANSMQVHCVALSADGKRLATGGQQAGTCLWDVDSGELVAQFANDNTGRQHPDQEVSLSSASQVLCLQFSPDGRQLAVGDMLGVKTFELQSGTVQHDLNASFRFGRSGLAYSPDGQWLARFATDKVVLIWSARTGQLLYEIPTEAHGVDFSADRQWFATGFSHASTAASVWQLFEPSEATTNRSNDDSTERITMAEAVRRFNLDNQRRDRGQGQPPLTEEEVIAAIRRAEKTRDAPNATEPEFAAFKRLADDGTLPAGSEIEVLTGLQPDAFTTIQLWSIRLVMPAVGRPGTVGFTIRDTKISEERIDPKSVAWGKPDASGLAVGLTLFPQKQNYAEGERVQLRLFVRNEGNPLETSFPNITWLKGNDILVVESNTAKVGVRGGHEHWIDEAWVAGAVSVRLASGDVHRLRVPFEIQIGGQAIVPSVGRVLDVRSGQKLQMRVQIPTGDHSTSDTQALSKSGIVRFAVTEEAVDTARQQFKVRLIGSDTKKPLSSLSVQFVSGYGSEEKVFGSYTTDKDGVVEATLAHGFYTLRLSSEKELPYLDVEELWKGRPRRGSPRLNVLINEKGATRWLNGDAQDAGDDVPTQPGQPQRLTYRLLPGCDLHLRAVDAETGKGLAGVTFYTENALGEEWGHSIEGANLGWKSPEGNPNAAGELKTDENGDFHRFVGANDNFKYGVETVPAGYEQVDPRHEVEILVRYGQPRATQVFKFRRIGNK